MNPVGTGNVPPRAETIPTPPPTPQRPAAPAPIIRLPVAPESKGQLQIDILPNGVHGLVVPRDGVRIQTAAASVSSGELPGNVCGRGSCSPEQQRVFDAFQKAGAPKWNDMPRVFSGHLYLRGAGSTPSQRHFAGFLIDTVEDGYTFDGSMAFGGSTRNPYQDLDVPAARKRFQGRTPDFLERYDTHGFIDLSRGGNVTIRYWVRQDPDSGTLYIIQQLGGGLGTMELNPHPK